MTLDREVGQKPGDVRLVECPFCGADLSPRYEGGHGPAPTDHLQECEAFEDAWRDGEGADHR